MKCRCCICCKRASIGLKPNKPEDLPLGQEY